MPSPITRMPVLFMGHGNPMNALADNAFTQTLNALGLLLKKPKAILCISAHWLTEGTWVTHMPNPRTIHDFSGFPPALSGIQYPAPGNSLLAQQISQMGNITLDDELWGLDHGTWSVLRHLYPKADIPVLQLSINFKNPPRYHYEMGQLLKPLRDEGVLIIGSGNIVHNLNLLNWSPTAAPYDWAIEFDEWVKEKLLVRDDEALLHEATELRAGKLSIPTVDHWYPLLYVLGAADKEDPLNFEYEGLENGSISMRSFSLGRELG